MPHVLNRHETLLAAEAETVGRMLDRLAAEGDPLWPRRAWPAMRLDGPLAPGATGGHGPIRYRVESYEPGRRITFRFTGPRGFDGAHTLSIERRGPRQALLAHVIDMRIHGLALLTWPLVFRPLHDALIEDAMALAEVRLGMPPRMRPWPLYVRVLRWLMSAGSARGQQTVFRPAETTADV